MILTLLAAEALADVKLAKTGDDIIVTARRDPADRTEQINAAAIGAFGADTIGDVLERLRTRLGDTSLSITVNGRRLSGEAGILEFPPEALERIEIASDDTMNAAPGHMGVINLVLRRHFEAITAETSASTAVQGGGARLSLIPRVTRIREEKRSYASMSLAHDAGLREDQRFPLSGAFGRECPPGESMRQSLLPEIERIDLVAGIALPAGSHDVAAEIATGQSRSLTVLGSTVRSRRSRSADGAHGTTLRRMDTGNIHLGANLEGNMGDISWSLHIGGDASDARSSWHPRQPLLEPRGRGTSASPPASRQRSTSRGLDWSGVVQAPIAHVPAGAIRLAADFRISDRRQHLTSQSASATGETAHDRLATAEIGADIPLVGRSVTPLSWLGAATLHLSGDVDHVGGASDRMGGSRRLTWAPVHGLSVSYAQRSHVAPAPATQRYALTTHLPNQLIYDARAGHVVAATLLTGGRPDLPPSTDLITSYRLSAEVGQRSARLGGDLELSTTRMIHPTLVVQDATATIERVRPALIHRDTAGHLLDVDARPFAVAETARRIISVGAHASGRDHGASRPPHSSAAMVHRIDWTLSLRYERTLRYAMTPNRGGASIDLLASPPQLSASSAARDSVSLFGGVTAAGYGFTVNGTWHGRHGGERDNRSPFAVTASPLAIINVGAWMRLGGVATRDHEPLRLRLEGENVFAQRVQLSRAGHVDQRESILSDPLGRVIKLVLRRSF